LRQRWLGATGGKVPAIAVEGELGLPPETLVLDVLDIGVLRQAHAAGLPVAVRADSAEDVKAALSRPEVSCVLVPPTSRDLLDLDLRELTYG
jgi:hypothetical protein